MKEGFRFTIMKIFSFIKDTGAIIAGTIKRCPVNLPFLSFASCYWQVLRCGDTFLLCQPMIGSQSN